MKPIVFAASTLLLALLLLEAPQLLSESTAVTSYVPNALFHHNFHIVEDGAFYRSARMPAKQLEDVISRYDIKTVINLSRGSDKSEGFEPSEQTVVESLGASYYEIPLNAGRMPSRPRLMPLLEVYDKATPPILVHCTSGTHRSGVAAAIWLLDQRQRPFSIAREQLSARYGYFWVERQIKSFWTGYPTIDELLWRYQADAELSQMSFRTWTLERLAPYDSNDDTQNRCSIQPEANSAPELTFPDHAQDSEELLSCSSM